jgi:protein phosphatase
VPAGGGEDDLAGFTTAMPAVDPGLSDEALDSIRRERPTRAQRRAERKRTPRTRVTWRVLLFLVLLLAVVGGAFATIQWYGTSTYFVAFDEQDQVVIYQGRPGGILWVDPELERETGIDREDVPARYVPRIIAGNEQATLAKALQLVENIERDIAEREEREDSTTTTRPGSTTSTTAGTTTTRTP